MSQETLPMYLAKYVFGPEDDQPRAVVRFPHNDKDGQYFTLGERCRSEFNCALPVVHERHYRFTRHWKGEPLLTCYLKPCWQRPTLLLPKTLVAVIDKKIVHEIYEQFADAIKEILNSNNQGSV